MTSITLALQRALYGITIGSDGNRMLPLESSLWYLRNLAVVGAISAVLFVLALRMFTKAEGNFAEDL
jgi:hypothetical protein